MPKLDRQFAAMLVYSVSDLGKRLDLAVIEQLRHQQRRHDRTWMDMGATNDDEANAAFGALFVIIGSHVDK